MKNTIIVLFISIFYSSCLYADTVVVDCPQIKVDNPYKILSPSPAGWEADNVSASYLNCRSHINPQGYLKCTYKASAHSTVNTYGVKRMPPENTTCKAKDIGCGFICTKTQAKYSPDIKAPLNKIRK